MKSRHFWSSVKEYGGADYIANVKAFARPLSAKTIQNCRDVAKVIVPKHISYPAFRAKMRSKNENQRVAYFGNLATPSMKHFIFRHHFKALNFAYIFHKASRPVRLKETTRQNLRLRIDFITATMLYTTLLPVTREILSKKNLTTPKNDEAEAFPELDDKFNWKMAFDA
ncbi:hypothetical protein VE01_08653 [Pseudogymnoascus verrucosus]|uniref:Uncharacterized protein n=1 Tax=Pseudogymnoascus verrucosus TaxID=342668 RepID=A0A1B8GCA4_9PEZI|nr:uncharacterized protein VE01_08653 [Pseudogymnoascus verrucosus]OBT93453.1 hypothetical protein VE01_08653 [Pseudogymnoascus verrucosus]